MYAPAIAALLDWTVWQAIQQPECENIKRKQQKTEMSLIFGNYLQSEIAINHMAVIWNNVNQQRISVRNGKWDPCKSFAGIY